MGEDDPDGPKWSARLHRAIETVREWERLVQRRPDPHSLSELAQDDEQWPTSPVSAPVWMSLQSAVEHLGLAADDMERVLTGQGWLRSQAPFTLTRSALMGASQAVWVLGSNERETRVRRGLSLASHDLKDQAEFYGDYLKDEDLHHDISADLRAGIQKAHQRAVDWRKQISRHLGGEPPKLTRILREAAEHLTAQRQDRWQLRALTYEWRMSSASAHGRMWPFFVRDTERAPHPEGGQIWRLTASLRECATAMGAAVLMTSEGLHLWDRRAGRPNAGAAFGLDSS